MNLKTTPSGKAQLVTKHLTLMRFFTEAQSDTLPKPHRANRARAAMMALEKSVPTPRWR